MIIALATAAGCGSSDFVDAASGVEGIYQIDSHTRNPLACEPGGEAVASSDGFVIAATQSAFGIDLLSVVSCASVADCRAKLAALRGGGGVSFEFSFTLSATRGDDLLGQGASTGFGDGGTCRQGEISETVLSIMGDALRIEQAVTLADDYPASSDGFCTTDGAKSAASGNPCSELEVLTATLVEPL